MDIISAAGESHIPETEQLYAGGSEMFMKAVSSGAQIAGRPLVSAEAFIFVGRAFMTTPLKLKALADKAFSAGINQLVYHGSSYQLEDHVARGYPVRDGWYPWQLGLLSTDYSEHWPFWQHAAEVNHYLARSQYLLRKGQAEADVLILYPGLSFPQGYGNPQEPFNHGRFEGEEPLPTDTDSDYISPETKHMRSIWQEARKLEQEGLSWAWVNEKALEQAVFEDGWLKAGGLSARGLRLHGVEAMSPNVAEHLVALASAGLPVQLIGNPPHRQRGLVKWQRGDERVQRALASLQTVTGFRASVTSHDNPVIKPLRRRLENGDLLLFFTNPTAQPTALSLTVHEPFQQALWLDAWHVSSTPSNPASPATTLPAYGSQFLWLRNTDEQQDETRHWETRVRRPIERWHLAVTSADYEHEGQLPGDWLALPALRNSGGPGLYRAVFPHPGAGDPMEGTRYLLSLGNLHGAANIRLNGHAVGAVLVPPYAVEVTEALQPGTNTLEVELIVPRKNRLVEAIAMSEPGWNAPALMGEEQRVSAGLLGPVEILTQSASN